MSNSNRKKRETDSKSSSSSTEGTCNPTNMSKFEDSVFKESSFSACEQETSNPSKMYAILIEIQGNTNRLLEEKKELLETKESKKFHSKVAEELKKENEELKRGVARLAEPNENFTSTVTKLQQRLEDIETQQDEM